MVKTEEYNKGVSFRIASATFEHLCRAILQVPGVVFSKKRRFFWSSEDVGAEFTLKGHNFFISTDEWDDALWIMTKDSGTHCSEMQELRDAVEKYEMPQTTVGRLLNRLFARLLQGKSTNTLRN